MADYIWFDPLVSNIITTYGHIICMKLLDGMAAGILASAAMNKRGRTYWQAAARTGLNLVSPAWRRAIKGRKRPFIFGAITSIAMAGTTMDKDDTLAKAQAWPRNCQT